MEKFIKNYNFKAKEKKLLPIQVSKFYENKIKEEFNILWNYLWPLSRIVYPTAEKMNLFVDLEFTDWVDDKLNTICESKWSIIQKYANRIIFMPTNICASNCQYCFRQNTVKIDWNIKNNLEILKNFLVNNIEIDELILSWWDPLILSEDHLSSIFDIVNKITRKIEIRIHSKVIVFNPDLINKKK